MAPHRAVPTIAPMISSVMLAPDMTMSTPRNIEDHDADHKDETLADDAKDET